MGSWDLEWDLPPGFIVYHGGYMEDMDRLEMDVTLRNQIPFQKIRGCSSHVNDDTGGYMYFTYNIYGTIDIH